MGTEKADSHVVASLMDVTEPDVATVAISRRAAALDLPLFTWCLSHCLRTRSWLAVWAACRGSGVSEREAAGLASATAVEMVSRQIGAKPLRLGRPAALRLRPTARTTKQWAAPRLKPRR